MTQVIQCRLWIVISTKPAYVSAVANLTTVCLSFFQTSFKLLYRLYLKHPDNLDTFSARSTTFFSERSCDYSVKHMDRNTRTRTKKTAQLGAFKSISSASYWHWSLLLLFSSRPSAVQITSTAVLQAQSATWLTAPVRRPRERHPWPLRSPQLWESWRQYRAEVRVWQSPSAGGIQPVKKS